MPSLKELVALQRPLTTDEFADAMNQKQKMLEKLENLELKSGEDYILLKWGTLKGWELHSEVGKKLSNEYLKLGVSMGVMQQKDTDRQKEIILEMIDECDGSIQSDWSGEFLTKEEAKKYINDQDQ